MPVLRLRFIRMSFLLVLLFAVGLPCASKQAIKQALDLPVAESQMAKMGASTVCSSAETSQRISAQQERIRIVPQPIEFNLRALAMASISTVAKTSDADASVKPIRELHILYQQFRI